MLVTSLTLYYYYYSFGPGKIDFICWDGSVKCFVRCQRLKLSLTVNNRAKKTLLQEIKMSSVEKPQILVKMVM